MFKIIALVCMLNPEGGCKEFTSAADYASAQLCEVAAKDSEKSFMEFLGVVYGVGPEQVKVEFKCEFKPRV